MGYCCVPSCKSTQSKGISFHKFPTSIESKRRWIIAISQQGNPRGSHWSPKGRSTICSKHFNDNDYSISTTKKILLPSAVPSVFEDIVGQRMARRLKSSVKAERETVSSRLNKTKKQPSKTSTTPPVEEEISEEEPDRSRKAKKIKQITVVPDAVSVENGKARPREIRKSTRGQTAKQSVKNDLSVETDVPEITSSIVKEKTTKTTVSEIEGDSETETMQIEVDAYECATVPTTEDASETRSGCDGRSESPMECAPRSSTIKISKNFQLVLRKLVTTIENQRAEISRLKKERDALNQQLYNLKRQEIKGVHVKM